MSDTSLKAKLVISIDTELAWGMLDRPHLEHFYPNCAQVDEIIEDLLELFDDKTVPACWALVGRLLEEGPPPPHIPRGALPFLRSTRLPSRLAARRVGHEIACHSYGHVPYDQLSEEEADRDLSQACRVAAAHGVRLRSFVFPRNRVKHLHLLSRHGFTSYRAEDTSWFGRFPAAVGKILRQVDLLMALPSAVGQPTVGPGGIVRIPGGLLFRIPQLGLRNKLPASLWVRKAKGGLRRAVRSGAVFHLWFHAYNFGYRRSDHFAAFEQVLEEACRLRHRGCLETMTMSEIAERTSRLAVQASPSVARTAHPGSALE